MAENTSYQKVVVCMYFLESMTKLAAILDTGQ